MENNIFIGPFKNELFDFYNYKISLGYDFKSQLVKLEFFDKYTSINYNKAEKITKEIVINFIEHTNTNRNSKSSYASVLRQLTSYLSKNDIETYVIPMKIYTRGCRHIPYIFTDDEILRIFKSLDNYKFKNQFKKDIVIMIFKLLYCTGMRISEVLNIRVKDINFDKKSIHIHTTKSNVERIIVINDTLSSELSKIIKQYEKKFNNDFIFVHNDGRRYKGEQIYDIFRNALFYAKIRHTGSGPRLHDFRFTFCTKSLRKLVEENKDLNTYIPILSAYMGHRDFKSTEYYLTLTAEVYPNIRNKMEEYSHQLIREIDWGDFDD